MKTKSVPALVKSSNNDDSLEEGQFTAVVSVFNTVDSVGDVVLPGAFKDSLNQWSTKGSPLPVVWSHDWSDPFSHIGYVTEAKETDTGLQVKGQLDLENPKAKQVYNLLKGGRVRNWSFAYDIDQARPGERNGKSVQELHQLSVHEIGPTLVGAHKDTDTVDVKAAPNVTVNVNPPAAVAEPDTAGDQPAGEPDSHDAVVKALTGAVDGLKAGRVLSKANADKIRQIHGLTAELLAAIETPSDQPDDSKAMPAQPSQPEPPAVVAPGPDPARHGAAPGRLRVALELLEGESFAI
ncbi:MAG TPA: HK97 family phage prohead protease [Pseudonocardia sp.]